MAKGIFIAENMQSTKLASLLRSGQQEPNIENGMVVTLGDLIDPERDLYATAPVAANTDDVYLVDGVELQADEQLTKGLDDFENLAEKPFRLRKGVAYDRFSVSTSVLDGTPVEGKFVETPATGNKLKVVDTPTEGASFVAEIQNIYVFGTRGIEMARLLVK